MIPGSDQLWQSLPEALRVIGKVDRVELKAIVDTELESALAVLGAHVGRPRRRRVHYLDTPDLALHRRGIIIRARVTNVSGAGHVDGDVVVKLRRPAPQTPPRAVGLAVELDALPSETVWAASMKRRLSPRQIERALLRRRCAQSLLKKKQRGLLEVLVGDEIDTDDLVVLGPVDVVRVTAGKPGARIGIEGWALPDGSRIVEVFAKCRPARSCAMAARIRDLIGAHGISLADNQATKTQMSLTRLVKIATRGR
jgi:hypothetical protein